ncbi:MAG: response regulator, partial [Candidatus Tectimicrobiota bacterium]
EESATEVLLRFAVHDTGMGLAPEAQQQVFQPNALRHCLTAPSYRHSGLGLVICKHLVDLMGGQIGFESRPGQGSTVWCTGRFGKGTEPSEAVRHTPTWLQSARVLCVDDHAFDRTLLHQQLLAWGMQVDCVADGLSALAHLRSAQADGEPYTLALLDLMMPSMDGRMLARAIKGDPALSTVRLVLLTTANQQAQAELARPLGFAATLTKPLHPTQLYACLLGLLGGTEAAERRTPVLPPAREAEAPRRRLRVLLAEDNFINQKVAVRLLEKLGCQVDIAANGHEALQALERTTYALVFMDCHMPEMDGYAATRAIRQREALTGAHIPIIAMTAHARQGAREQCLAAGMDDYVSKPVLSEQLAAIVQQWTPAAAPDTSCAAAVRPCALASAGPAVVL